jgi:hypothetical protein
LLRQPPASHPANAGGVGSVADPLDQIVDQGGVEVRGAAGGIRLIDELHQQRMRLSAGAVRRTAVDVVAAGQRRPQTVGAGEGSRRMAA